MATDKDIKFQVSAEDRFSRVFGTLRRDIAGIGDETGRLRDITREAASVLTGGILGAGVVGGLVAAGAAIQRFANDLDALNDVKDATGATVENISALLDVARRNGGDLDLVTGTLGRLQKTLAEARPDNQLGRALQRLGLDAQQLRALDPAQAVLQVAQALNTFADGPEKAQFILALFGKQAKDAAAFLKDLGDEGALVAKVTTQQAEAAERFNKQLFALQTSASNAARALVADLLPALNDSFSRLQAVREVFGGVGGGLVELTREAKVFTDAGQGVAFYTDKLRVLQQQRAVIEQDRNPVARRGGLLDIDAEIARVEKLERYYRRVFALTAADNGQSDPRELARRGRVTGLPTLPDIGTTGGETAARVNEAEQYLERLRRQEESLQRLTVEQQLLRDIEQGRIDGLTPKLEKQLLLEARRVDALQAQQQVVRAQQQALDDLIATASRRSEELDQLLSATPSGRRAAIERRVDVLLKFSRANQDDEGVQRQVLEALQQARDEIGALDAPVGKADAEFRRLETTIDRFADNTIDAIAGLASGVEGSTDRLWQAFKADVLRELVEDPVRDSMRNVVKIIRDELSGPGGVEAAFAKVFDWIRQLGSTTGGGGLGDLFSWFSSLGGGSTTRANGGAFRGGDMMRWQEHGREWALTSSDGTVITQAQLKDAVAGAVAQRGGGAQFIVQVQGDASENTIALIQAAQAQFAARMGLQGA